ncbi:MAG: ABC transporter permease [Defluviitaleaceae bacterium]|nr:ABC transporter permease [Defluviitaleaceae bacterium]MCL2238547.1 ABC transporter permease [Defluviitaleaceae bacterium]
MNVNSTSHFHAMWREIRRDKLAIIGLILFVGIMLTVYVWGFFLNEQEAMRMDFRNMNRAPSAAHILGTDDMGRDMVQLMVIAARNSLNISFLVTIVGASIGILLGLVMGFYAGHVDNVMMRIVNFWGMIPGIMMIILLRSLLSPATIWGFSWIVIGVFGWTTMTFTIRVMALRQGRLDYVSASKTLGTPNIVIMFREVLPNLVSILTSGMTLVLAGNMGLETGLSFLGLGLPPGTPSLGGLLSVARNLSTMQQRPWQWLPPALLVFILMLCINFVGQAINRSADAKKRSV